MPTYTQANRPLTIKTPLGQDILLSTRFRGCEAISQLFNFQVHLLTEAANEIQFDRILGQNVTMELRLNNQEKRYFNGLVKRFSQGGRDETFVHFSAEIVPKLWLLTKKVRSRIFQHLTVPDILRQLFAGFDVSYELSATYYQRDYCVQYRETDFNFASRLMEEEGIYYFFKHGDGSHQLVVTDVATLHPMVAGQSSVIYDEVSGGERDDLRITAWEKSQELRSGQYTLWDHCFELPGKNLEAKRKTTDTVTVGEVTHRLSVGGNEQLEIYDYPGGYAQRFDGIGRDGVARPQDLRDILPDSERTVKVRMEEEAAASLEIEGASNCGQFVAGHQFTLKRHFDADGQYALTHVEHDAHLDGDYRSSQASAFTYENRFTCIPGALPYRPPRMARRPLIAGIQTATVVGPQGEEIFCDKYGRVKVQFHWDREGKKDPTSSCWLRVSQVWAGKGWGAFFWPRIGHEVVVVFEEGDPDQPLIVGSVYNAENMPPYELPKKKVFAGLRSATHKGTPYKDFNGIIFNDQTGHEHLSLHSEHNMSFNSEYDKMIHAGRHKGERVAGASIMTVGNIPMGGGSGGGNGDGLNAGILTETPGGGGGNGGDMNAGAHGSGGGNGGDMNAGNTMPAPGPISELPGLNALMVFGENMQAVVGLNHQLSIGNNHQICINPLGLLAGVPGIPFPAAVSGAMGAGVGGNFELTLGASASVTMGQAFEISIGKKKINIEGGYKDHKLTVILCGVLAAAAIAYAIGYGLKNANNQYIACGNFTIAYQTVVDATLIAIMVAENMFEDEEDVLIFGLNDIFGVEPNEVPESESTATSGTGWLAGCTAGVALLGAITVPLALAGKDSQVGDQQSAADAPAGGGSGVEIISRTPPPPAPHGKNVITLLATGEELGTGKGGYVEVRGNAGVRITAGPPPFLPTSSDSTNGVDIIVGELQTVTIQRGVEEGFEQKIKMSEDFIEIDASPTGTLTLKAGASSITLNASGITITGPLVRIN
jgi:type VI secretion system secreted protein VgrG